MSMQLNSPVADLIFDDGLELFNEMRFKNIKRELGESGS